MAKHGLQLLEVTGFSTTVADAIRNALVQATLFSAAEDAREQVPAQEDSQ